MANGDTKTEALLNILGNGGDASSYKGCCNTKTQSYILDAIDRVQSVEDEVEELKNNPDVVDIVDTYADLQAYDTQHLTENDIIRVLQDETHSGNSTYYRFTKNPDTWTFIGEISGGGGSVNVVQTTGTSTTDVMSQNATTSMVFADPATQSKIKIGSGTAANEGTDAIEIGHNSSATNTGSTAVGGNSTASGPYTTAIGTGARASNEDAVAVGYDTRASQPKALALGRGSAANHSFSIALGAGATTSAVGEINVSTGALYPTRGYNNSNYRLLTGLYDPQNDHDAATKGYVDSHSSSATISNNTLYI